MNTQRKLLDGDINLQRDIIVAAQNLDDLLTVLQETAEESGSSNDRLLFATQAKQLLQKATVAAVQGVSA